MWLADNVCSGRATTPAGSLAVFTNGLERGGLSWISAAGAADERAQLAATVTFRTISVAVTPSTSTWYCPVTATEISTMSGSPSPRMLYQANCPLHTPAATHRCPGHRRRASRSRSGIARLLSPLNSWQPVRRAYNCGSKTAVDGVEQVVTGWAAIHPKWLLFSRQSFLETNCMNFNESNAIIRGNSSRFVSFVPKLNSHPK